MSMTLPLIFLQVSNYLQVTVYCIKYQIIQYEQDHHYLQQDLLFSGQSNGK